MKEKETGANKGYAFVTFTNRQDAEKAIATLGECEIKVRRGKGIQSHMSMHVMWTQMGMHACSCVCLQVCMEV